MHSSDGPSYRLPTDSTECPISRTYPLLLYFQRMQSRPLSYLLSVQSRLLASTPEPSYLDVRWHLHQESHEGVFLDALLKVQDTLRCVLPEGGPSNATAYASGEARDGRSDEAGTGFDLLSSEQLLLLPISRRTICSNFNPFPCSLV
jgi:hypothetical protein